MQIATLIIHAKRGVLWDASFLVYSFLRSLIITAFPRHKDGESFLLRKGEIFGKGILGRLCPGEQDQAAAGLQDSGEGRQHLPAELGHACPGVPDGP